MEQLVAVWRAAEMVLRPEAVKDWPITPVPLLAHLRPIDFIRDGRAAEVLEAIGGLGEGAGRDGSWSDAGDLRGSSFRVAVEHFGDE